MNRFLKILKWFSIGVIAIFISLVLVAELAEDAIVNRALKEVNSSVSAQVDISDISFSLLKRFPLATIEFQDILVTSTWTEKDSITTKDTLLNAQKLYVSLDAIALLKGKFDVKRFDLEEGACTYCIDKEGNTNFDFILSEFDNNSNESSSDGLDIDLKKIIIKDFNLLYKDFQNSIQARIFFEKNTAKLKLNQNLYQAQIKGNARCTDCRFADMPLQKMKMLDLRYQFIILNGKLRIEALNLLSDGVDINLIGNIDLNKNFLADIQIQNSNINLDRVSKYIPHTFLCEYDIKKIVGLLSLNASIKGELLDSLLPQIDVNLILNKGEFVSGLYPLLNSIDLKCKLGNGEQRNLQTSYLNCEKLNFISQKSRANSSFKIKDFIQPEFLISSDCNINIVDFATYIPDSLLRVTEGQVLANFEADGKLSSWSQLQDINYLRNNCKGTIQIKDLSGKMFTHISVDSLSGKLTYNQDSIRVQNLGGFFPDYHLNLNSAFLTAIMRGSLDNPDQFGLKLSSFHIQTDSCQLLGSASLHNLTDPNYKISSQLALNLAELKKMIPDSLITDMTGQVGINFKSEGHFHPDSMVSQLTDLLMNKTKTEINFQNMNVQMPKPMMDVKGLSGQISLEPDTISINNIRGVFAGVDFKVDSSLVTNYYRTLIENKAEELSVRGFLNFGNLDYDLVDSLMACYASQTDSIASEDLAKPVNYSYQVKGRISGDSFNYKTAKFTDIQSLFNLRDSLYIFDQFKFKAFGGQVNSSIKYTIDSDNRQLLSVKNNTEQVDINQFLNDFHNFEDFDQNYIVADQISGKLTTELHGKFLILADTLVKDSTLLRGDLKLENGALYNYEPLQALSKSTNISDLDNMKFKTIESQVFIFKNAVFVPQTEIKSNAMDISALGMQTFDEDYAYHLRIYLGEILYGKTKRIRKKQENNKTKSNGGASGLKALFVVSESIDGKTKNGFDTPKARNKMKIKVKMQLMKLEIIFHPKIEKFETGVSPF